MAHYRVAEYPEPIDLEAQRGRVVVACAFQMLCPGCVSRAIPQMKAMQMKAVHERFAKQGVLVVGLHTVFEHPAAMKPGSYAAAMLASTVPG